MRRYLVLFVLLLAACGTPETVARPTVAPTTPPAPATAVAAADPCGAEALQVYRAAYSNIIDRWGITAIKAGQTQAADLKAPIDELQKIADDLAALKPPQCAQQAHDDTLQAMRLTIEGYQNLMAQKEVGQMLRGALDSMAHAQAEVNALPGTPVPAPTLEPSPTPLPTFTPLPTATPTETPVPTATPEPRSGYTNKQALLYESPTSTNPIKTIFKGTRVLVFETLKGRTHIKAGSIEGWIPQGAVVVR